MGWCRRLISNAFRCYQPKIDQHRNPIQESVYHSKISRISALQKGLKQSRQWKKNPFLDVAKRSYYVGRNQVRGGPGPRYVLILVVVVTGLVVTARFGDLETVPYTKRTRFVILSRSLEKRLGETIFNQLKTRYKENILPPLDPDSIRVQRIAKDIIDGLNKELTKEHVWSDSPEISDRPVDEEEKLQRRKQGIKSQAEYLEGLEWEVIVVNDPKINAFCVPGGKIVVFTGLLNHLGDDAEVATIIGHEVGHAVARHTAELLSNHMWLAILQLVCEEFYQGDDIVNTMLTLSVLLSFSRSMEIEADYVGVMLVASAGYDPRGAPQVLEKLGKLRGESVALDYMSTHPSSKTRTQLLGDAKVMEEALNIYREVQARRGVEAFL